ncbi:MAG: protease inhibitor I42 family protein [Thermoleophilia bacterium]|nr:protease inhibitor I42 family protein [Thermoleophilia bacterium]
MARSTARAMAVTLAVLALLLGLGSTALAASWSDIDDGILDTYGVTLDDLSQVSAGFPDGSWRPWQSVTRAQFVKMAGATFVIDQANPETPTFSDVPSTDPYYEHVEGAYLAGLIKGVGGGLFAPASTLTREQAVGIVARQVAADQSFDLGGMPQADVAAALGGFTDGAAVSAGLRAEMAFAITRGLVKGDGSGTLAPQSPMSRIAAAAVLLRAKGVDEIVLDETDDGTTLKVKVNDLFKVVLKGNPTTGYAWTAVISEDDAAVLRQVGEPVYVSDAADEGMVGVGGTYTFTFEALAAGEAALKLEYARPWESEPPLQTFTVTVQVETSPVSGTAMLDGTTWALETWSVSSLDPGDFVITAAFEDGRISGKAAVNQYGGPYTADASGAFSVGVLVHTLMAGPEPAMLAESTYFDLLEQARSYELDDDHLTLLAEGGSELLIFVTGPVPVTVE